MDSVSTSYNQGSGVEGGGAKGSPEVESGLGVLRFGGWSQGLGLRVPDQWSYTGTTLIRKCHHRALRIILLQGPRGLRFLMSQVPL